jgi:hypothetical protein
MGERRDWVMKVIRGREEKGYMEGVGGRGVVGERKECVKWC